MPRAKPSSEWEGLKLKYLDVRHLYSAECLDKILALLRPKESVKRPMLEDRITGIAGHLSFELAHRHRPTSGQQRAALGPLKQHLAKSLGLLSSLDADSLRRVRSIAEQDEPGEDEPATGYSGRYRVEVAAQHLDKLLRWVHAAEENLPRTKSKKILLEAERVAVQSLLDLWTEMRLLKRMEDGTVESSRPTLNQFTTFVEAALAPVFRAHKRKTTDLRSICAEILPSPKRKVRR
jgi:hypothetical protein